MEAYEYDHNLANRYTRKEMKNARGNPIFQTKNAIKDHDAGHLGEIIFDRWLMDKDIEYEWVNNLNGIGDKGRDFIIHKNCFSGKLKSYVIDVKTANPDTFVDEIGDGYRFKIAEQQYKKHPSVDFFFNIQLDPDWEHAYLIGGLHYDMVPIFGVKRHDNNVNPSYDIPLIDLTHPDIWLQELLK